MTNDVKVLEDGLEEHGRQRPDPSWLWLTVGFLIGVGLAVVFFTAGRTEPAAPPEDVAFPGVDETDETDEATQEPIPTTLAELEGVGEMVGEFPDTLVAITQVGARSMEYLTWPLAGPPFSTPLAGFSTGSVKFDVSGRMMAMAANIPGSDHVLLSLGRSQRTWPLADDVSGYAWHDSEPGRLAYTQVVDDEWRLWLVGSSLESELVTRGIGLDGRVVTWGDWGYAIQGEGVVNLLTPDGDFEEVIEGRALDSSPDGQVVVSDGDLKLVSAGGGVKELDVDLGLIGQVEAASVSPDGTKLVVVGGAGHMIVPVDGEGEVIHAPVTSGFPQLSWTSDSRFVIAPWIRGILIIDSLAEARFFTGLTSHTVVAAATIPLTER